MPAPLPLLSTTKLDLALNILVWSTITSVRTSLWASSRFSLSLLLIKLPISLLNHYQPLLLSTSGRNLWFGSFLLCHLSLPLLLLLHEGVCDILSHGNFYDVTRHWLPLFLCCSYRYIFYYIHTCSNVSTAISFDYSLTPKVNIVQINLTHNI